MSNQSIDEQFQDDRSRPLQESLALSPPVRAATVDHLSLPLHRQQARYHHVRFPEQACSSVHQHPQFHHRVLRPQSSYPAHLTMSQSISHISRDSYGQPGHPRAESGSRTTASSPSISPAFASFENDSVASTPTLRGAYSSGYLLDADEKAPKETHVADIDVDPFSGNKIINNYEIIRELGRGVHGKVKLGRSLKSGSYVAIKIVERYSKKLRLGKNTSHTDKIKKEIAILKKVRHPNIVSLIEVIDDPSRKKVYIVLEHVEMGEVKWRTEGVKEIVMATHKRIEQERQGLPEDTDFLQTVLSISEQEARYRKGLSGEHISICRSSEQTQRHSEECDLNFNTEHHPMYTKSILSPHSEKNVVSEQYRDCHVPLPFSKFESTCTTYTEDDCEPTQKSIHYQVPEDFYSVPLMTLPEARSAFRDTVLGLEYLHYQGIIHRDIKPANLLLTKDRRVKISDFGVSYLGQSNASAGEDFSESEQDEDEAVELAKTVGTPAFYAPELCITDFDKEQYPVTSAIDVWALGVTLFCLVFARVPFHDTNSYKLMRSVAEDDVHIPEHRLCAVDEQNSRPTSPGHNDPANSIKRSPYELIYEEVDADLRDLLEQLLIKDPRERITLKKVKLHPWLLHDIEDRPTWLHETDPTQQTQGKKIEVSKTDVDGAVAPVRLFDRIASNFRKFSDTILKRTGGNRKHSKSTVSMMDSSSVVSTVLQDSYRTNLAAVDDSFIYDRQLYAENDHPVRGSLRHLNHKLP